APKMTLELGSQQPALAGEYVVETKTAPLKSVPVLALLREQVAAYTPEQASKITGTPPQLIRDLARQIAKAKSAMIVTQSNFSKFYHGLEMERAQFLVMALCGQFGKKGSGIDCFPYLSIDGNMPLGMAPPPFPSLKQVTSALWKGSGRKDDDTDEMFYLEKVRELHETGSIVSSTILFHTHGGLEPLTGSSRRWDPHLPREADEYLREAIGKGWQQPAPEPKIFFSAGGNILRRVRGNDRLKEVFLPKLSLMVT
ncbi:MAG: molybdopterin-dependent oxidoreductase, partial [bacterium]|nr:molybdopterin-dependent oxidoreductase [bacterium]